MGEKPPQRLCSGDEPRFRKTSGIRMDAACETVKKVVIPISSAHWRGNPPDDRNIFDSENIGFPKILGDRHTSLRAGSR